MGLNNFAEDHTKHTYFLKNTFSLILVFFLQNFNFKLVKIKSYRTVKKYQSKFFNHSFYIQYI